MIKTVKTDIRRDTRTTGRFGVLAWTLALAGLLLGLPAIAQSPDAAKQDVRAVGPLWANAAGTDKSPTEWLYLARTTVNAATPPAGETAAASTQIYRRSINKTYKEFGRPIPRRVLAITPIGEHLAVLTDDGNWLIQSAEGTTLGAPLPPSLPDARLIDFASDRGGLYAIAKVRGGVARLSDPATGPTTLPTTAPATAATRPATSTTGPASRPLQNAPDMLSILLNAGGPWQGVADIPPEVARPIDPVSLAIHNNTPFVLVREAPGRLRLWRVEGQKWSEVEQAIIPEKTRLAQLIPGGSRPTAWLSPPIDAVGEPDQVIVFDPSRANPVTRVARGATQPATAPSTRPTTAESGGVFTIASSAGTVPSQRSAAFSFNYFRSITFKDNAMSEQALDASTFAIVGTAKVQSFDPPGLPWFDILHYGLVAAAMAYAIMASIRRRADLGDTEIDPDALPLAPMMPRLMAGVIDAAPLILAYFYMAMNYGPDDEGAEPYEARVIVSAGLVAYLLLTTLTEVFAGRSLGKMLFGLRVISIDSRPATRGQLATRNILRLIDVLLTFFPLLLIPFSPLRQRAGDAAAGTIVVTTQPRQADIEEDDQT